MKLLVILTSGDFFHIHYKYKTRIERDPVSTGVRRNSHAVWNTRHTQHGMGEITIKVLQCGT